MKQLPLWCRDVVLLDVYGDQLAAGGRLRSGFRRALAEGGLSVTTYIDRGR